jgi:methyl-accepting chemotaxis protein
MQEILIIIFTIFVFISTTIAGYWRIKLYNTIISLNNKVRKAIERTQTDVSDIEILAIIQTRYQTASDKLGQQINTHALVNIAYSDRKLGSVAYERIEYLTKIVPSLLLSVGLLGTFLGITQSLVSINGTLTSLNFNEIDRLIEELKAPLSGMGTAFISSLLALILSTIITIINAIYNVTQAKYQLLSSMEDYLDNIYHAELQANSKTRFDRAVDNMDKNFENFLNNFGKTVRESVESSTKDKVKEISDAYAGVADLALQVYSRFGEAATTMSRSANDIESSANLFSQATHVLKETDFAKLLVESTQKLSVIESGFKSSTDSLAGSVSTIGLAVSNLEKSSDRFITVSEEIRDINKLYLEIGTIQESNQKILQEIIPALKLGAEILTTNIGKLENVEKTVNNRSESLRDIHTELRQLVSTVQAYTNNSSQDMLNVCQQMRTDVTNTTQYVNTIAQEIHQTSNNLISLTAQTNTLNQTSTKIYQSIDGNQTSLAQIIPQIAQGAQSISNAVSKFQELQSQTLHKYDNFDRITGDLSTFVNQNNIHNQESIELQRNKFQFIADNIEAYSKKIAELLGANNITSINSAMQRTENPYEQYIVGAEELFNRQDFQRAKYLINQLTAKGIKDRRLTDLLAKMPQDT